MRSKQEENIAFINIYALNIRDLNNNTIVAEDFNTPLTSMDTYI